MAPLQYYIVDGSNDPIALTKAGRERGPTDGGWNVTQVEESGDGYEVFWTRGSGRFEVWKVDRFRQLSVPCYC